MEKAAANGKFDPTSGLSSSGIAGTGTDKEEDDSAPKPANTDEEMKDVSKKDGGMRLNPTYSCFVDLLPICPIYLECHLNFRMIIRFLICVCPSFFVLLFLFVIYFSVVFIFESMQSTRMRQSLHVIL